MAKKLKAFLLALCLALALCVPTLAYDGASAAEGNVLSLNSFGSALVDAEGNLWMSGSPFVFPGEFEWNAVHPNDGAIQTVPMKVMEQVRSVSFGGGHQAILKKDGTLWLWGFTEWGKIGNDFGYDQESTNLWGEPVYIQSEPVQVLDRVASVCCGERCTAAIREDGTLWMWGDAASIGNGVKGNGENEYGWALQSVPVQVMTDVAAVSCGRDLTAVVKTDGSLWTWHLVNHDEKGYEKHLPSEPVKLLEGVKSVSCGDDHLLAVKEDGSLWAYGWNGSGQLGTGNCGGTDWDSAPVHVMDGVSRVSAGDNVSAAVRTDGTLLVWGLNLYGALGTGEVRLGGTRLYSEEDFVLVPYQLLTDVTDCRLNGDSGFAIRRDGSVWGWGQNGLGELGNDYQGNYSWGASGKGNRVPISTVPVETLYQAGVPAPEKPSKWAEAEVAEAISLGLVPEALQGGYKQNTTRAEFCALAATLYEALKGPVTERSGFIDTTDEAVEKMAALGVVNGVGEGRFDPKGKLTREQAAAMLARLAEALGRPVGEQAADFADSADISAWALRAVGQMQAAGVMNGTGEGCFSPKGTYSREQSILTILRLLRYLES